MTNEEQLSPAEKLYKAQKANTERYLKNFDQISIRVPKGYKEKLFSYAESQGLSFNAIIITLINKDAKDKGFDFTIPVPKQTRKE